LNLNNKIEALKIHIDLDNTTQAIKYEFEGTNYHVLIALVSALLLQFKNTSFKDGDPKEFCNEIAAIFLSMYEMELMGIKPEVQNEVH
jgi:hypothetical protein